LGETENQEATDNDENKENEETDENNENTKDNRETEVSQPSEQTATIFIPNPDLSDNEAFTMDKRQDEEDQPDKTNKEDERFFEDLKAYEETSSDEDKSDTEEVNREYYVAIIDGVRYLQYHAATPLPTIEPLPYSEKSELTGVPMTASMTPNTEQGSSSVKPDWGRTRQKTLQELEDEWQEWQITNIKTPEEVASEWSTPTYRHDRCHMCRKPVSVTWQASDKFILCQECAPNVIEDEMGEVDEDQRRDGRRDRDDEDEWGGIPIPQSDDSDSTYEWLSEDSENNEENKNNNKKKYLNCFMAFLIAPRKDGRVLNKDGTIIDINECPTTKGQQQTVILSKELPVILKAAIRPHWTKHLLAYQRQQLRRGYKKKDRPKVMMKVLRQIQRHHQTGNKLQKSEETTRQSRHIDIQPYHAIFHALIPQQFDATLGFLNQPNTLREYMNAVSPRQASKHKLSPVKTIKTDSYAKKSRNTFSPILIPGTPDAAIPDRQEEKSSDAGAKHEWVDYDDEKELENLDLYYKIFNRNRP
jgi:hypothetical protein